MERKLEINGVVVYIDEYRREHNALVTAIHGDPLGRILSPRRKPNPKPSGSGDTYVYEKDEDGNNVVDYGEPGTAWPCVNLVLVSPNKDCQDQYGRQLVRHSSVVHQSQSSAQGFCYRFVDEDLDPTMRQPTVS